MKDIAIYGAGGLGREIACLISKINEINPKWNIIGFFDDGKEKGDHNEYGMILGGIDEMNNWTSDLDVVIAIGNGIVVKKIVDKIINSRIDFPNIIYASWFADKKNIKLGRGNIISHGCVFSCMVNIGDFNLFNGGVSLGHDVQIKSYNTLMPSVKISGEVQIENFNFFGVGSIVLQQVKIGNNITLGAGSVLMRKPKENNLYIGNPAQIFKY